MANLKYNCNPKIKQSVEDLEKFQIKMPVETGLSRDCFRKREMEGPGMYQLSSHTETECFQEYPGYLTSGNSRPIPGVIDVESEFRGLNYRNTRCHTTENDPISVFRKMKSTKVDDCNPQMRTEYTKNQRSCNNISFITQNRFEYLTKPLTVQSNSYIGENTRLKVKNLEREKQQKFNRNPILPNPCNCGKLSESHFSSECSYLKDKNSNFITDFFMKK